MSLGSKQTAVVPAGSCSQGLRLVDESGVKANCCCSCWHLQAEHESGVTAVGVSPDGLQVAVGVESGALGVLDIPTHHYTPLLRSHTASVHAVVADPNRLVWQVWACIAGNCSTC